MGGSFVALSRVRIRHFVALAVARPTAQPRAIVPVATVAVIGAVVVAVVAIELIDEWHPDRELYEETDS